MKKVNDSLTLKYSEKKIYDASLAPPDFCKLSNKLMFTYQNESFMPQPLSSEESIKLNFKAFGSSSPVTMHNDLENASATDFSLLLPNIPEIDSNQQKNTDSTKK